MKDNQNQIEELLWRRLDGELSEAETASLRSLMGDSPQAQALEEEIMSVHEGLASVADEDLPPELKARLMEALSRRGLPGRSNRASVSTDGRWFPRLSWSTPVWRFAAAATLVVVAFVGYRLAVGGQGHSGDTSQYVGTISSKGSAREAGVVMNIGKDQGTVNISRRGSTVVLSIELAEATTVELRAATPDQTLRLVSDEPFSGSGPEILDAGVSWNLTGPGHFVLVVEPQVMEGAMEISAGNGEGTQSTLSVSLGDLPE